MKQLSLAEGGFEKYAKPSRRAEFLAQMERVVPWRELCELIEPHYPKAGNGRPPVGLERDLLSDWYERRYGEGFRYASLVPGMTRVVQAAGRLVRRPEDRGVVVLIGRRFRQEDARALLPDDWDVEVADDPAPSVAAFWEDR